MHSQEIIFLAKSPTKMAVGKPKNTLGMVQIPGGTFQMGSHSKDGRSDEYPLHSVQLKHMMCVDVDLNFLLHYCSTLYQTLMDTCI